MAKDVKFFIDQKAMQIKSTDGQLVAVGETITLKLHGIGGVAASGLNVAVSLAGTTYALCNTFVLADSVHTGTLNLNTPSLRTLFNTSTRRANKSFQLIVWHDSDLQLNANSDFLIMNNPNKGTLEDPDTEGWGGNTVASDDGVTTINTFPYWSSVDRELKNEGYAISAAIENVATALTPSNLIFDALATKAALSHNHAGLYAPISHGHAAADITSGVFDGDRLPTMSSGSKGGVPATGVATGARVLFDDGTWGVPVAPVGSVAWGNINGTLSDQVDLQAALDASSVWGGITGTLSDQTDLQTALDNSVTWGNLIGTLSDQTDLQSALENSSTWGNLIGTLSDQTDLQSALENSSTWGNLIGTLSDQTDLQSALENSSTWGNLIGTLSDQTDLQSALDGKAASVHSHSATDITSGELDGDRLPAFTASKKGGVPAVGGVSVGNYLKDDGTWSPVAGGGGGLSWSAVTSDTNAVKDNGYLVDPAAATTITLPATPSTGDSVGIKALDLDSTVSVARNGSLIEGIADDLTIDVAGAGFVLVYSGATYGWVVTTEISGGTGPVEVTKDASASDQTQTLPAISAANDGAIYKIGKTGDYKLTIQTTGTDSIADNGAGYGIETRDSGQAWVTLQADFTNTKWNIIEQQNVWMIEGLKLYIPCNHQNLYSLASAALCASTDQAAIGRYVSLFGSVASQGGNPFHAGVNYVSFLFDGIDAYAVAEDSPDWDIGASLTDDWTMDYYVMHDNATGTIVERHLSQFEDGSNLWSSTRLADETFVFQWTSGGSVDVQLTTSVHADTDWHRITIVKVAADWAIYVDGVREGTDTQTLTDTFTGHFYLGQLGSGTKWFNGQMSDVVISNSNIYGADPTSATALPTRNHAFGGIY